MNTWFYEYPLSEDEFQKLCKGELILKNFSPPFHPNRLICIVAWNKSLLGTLDKNKFEDMRKGGIDVANIPLATENLDFIKQGNGIQVSFPICTVMIGLAETFAKAKAEIEAKNKEKVPWKTQ
jgi:hypothetical protein